MTERPAKSLTKFALIKEKARHIKRESITLFFAFRHPATPWYAKLFTAIIVGYALSPIDLIPDFIPVLGYLDDIILLPLAITLAISMLPSPVLAECRAKAAAFHGAKPKIWLAAVVIVLLWLALIWAIVAVLR